MDIAGYAKFIATLAFVIALIAGFGWLVKRAGLLPATLMRKKSGKAARLAVSEVLPLDARHRLVLIQRDDVEHLLLLGPDGETVIERGIPANAKNRSASGMANNTTDNATNNGDKTGSAGDLA